MARILHVDDESDTLELVKLILEKEGFEVISACNGRECLEKINEDIDLVLLDIMMPDMSGWDVYQRIRKVDNKIKVAFLSVLDVSTERKRTLLKNGISDYITKPFDNDDLVRRVRDIIR